MPDLPPWQPRSNVRHLHPHTPGDAIIDDVAGYIRRFVAFPSEHS